jgi:hypothetical protein
MAKESNTQSNQESFNLAPDDAWFRCLSSTCHSAYQKKECDTPGVCPYCKGTAYHAEPWDSALLNNPQFPRVPQSGQKYGGTILA